MGGFVLICASGDERIHEAGGRLRAQAIAQGLTPVDLSPVAWLASWGPRPPTTLGVGAWTLIGDVHHRRDAPLKRVAPDDPHVYEKKLIARFWGGYVGVRLDGSGRPAGMLRDPSGRMDCVYWTNDGLTVIASDLPDWLVDGLRPPWTIAFDRVHHALHNPLTALGDLLLDGPIAVLPGGLHTLPEGQAITLWRPDTLSRDADATPLDDEQAGRLLVRAIDEAVSGLAGRGPVAAEVSGGLDSSLVASSLVSAGADVRLWLNAYGQDPASDERRYVAALADRLDISPVSHPRAEGVLTSELLSRMPQGLRPPFAALDGLHDADWARRLGTAKIETLLTGKGGDALFIQPATGAVFADLWRRRGWRALISPALPGLARWNERSVWSLVDEARHGAAPTSDDVNLVLTPLPDPGRPAHPWLEGISDLGPAKRMQIMGVVYGVGLHGPSLQTAVADVLHPLLMQPVVEACLALPTWQLTLGRRDRGLVRRAFADRLPPLILDRRSKGEMTAFYGHMLAGSLEVLRPWILDGRLSSLGLVDRIAAEQLLTPESLIWRGGYADLMMVAAMEGWVRAWEARLNPKV